jgi:hypothetical protein
LLKKLTSYQLAEWEAYNTIDPIGKWRSDYHISYLAWTITNLFIQAYGKKGTQLVNFDDFVFNWSGTDGEEKVQSVEEMRSILMALKASQDKEENSKGKDAKRVRTIPKK